MTTARVDAFLFEFKRWALTEAGIQAVALVGSDAVNAVADAAGIDLIVVVSPPNIYLKHKQWTSLFGTVVREALEDHGERSSLRIGYDEGFEVGFSFVDQSWAELPQDEATRKVAAGGMKVLFERTPLLSRLN